MVTSLANPTPDDIKVAAASLGFDLAAERADRLAVVIAGSLDAFRFVDAQPDDRDDAVNRTWQAIDDDDNPLGAWTVRGVLRRSDEGVLAGRTIAVKDSVAVAGWPMSNGTSFLDGFVPTEDATVVGRVLDEGAVIVGKAQCEFLCASGGSHTSATGPVRNPHDPRRMAGGSSSGSAALVAAGQVDMAIGGDQGGSVRMPASFSGVVGMKPTHSLVPYTGAASIESTVDHLGPITATVADNALLLDVLAGYDPDDHRQRPRDKSDHRSSLSSGVDRLRIGLVSEGFATEGSDAAVDDQVRAVAGRLRDAGAVVEDVSVPMHSASMAIFLPIVLGGFLHDVIRGEGCGTGRTGRQQPDYIEAHRGIGAALETAPANVQMLSLLAEHVRQRAGMRHYAKARQLAAHLTAAYDAALESFDALVMPTTPTTAPLIPDPDDDLAVIGAALGPLANTAAFDVTGHPALSVPAGKIDGLPVGLMLIGQHFDESTLYRIGGSVEGLDLSDVSS